MMTEWKSIKKDDYPQESCCCLVVLTRGVTTYQAIFDSYNKVFMLDDPRSTHPLITLDVRLYLQIPTLPEANE